MGIISPSLSRAEVKQISEEQGLSKKPAERPNQIEAVGVAKLELSFLEKIQLVLESIRTVLHETGVTK
jgi:hypothetical protein